MKKFHLYYSYISFLLYLSASFLFFFYYHNLQGGIWACNATFFVSLCWGLHVLHFTDTLQRYFKSNILDYLGVVGFTVALIGSVFAAWYIFAMVYWKIPLFEYDKTMIFPCVFSMLTGKWGLHLFSSCKEYSEMLNSAYSPLLQTI